ncbi:MAG: hypothetical protein ACR2OV_08390 [Hyphomicrobiaceae bacterium]
MSAVEPNWDALIVFLVCWGVVCSGWLYVSGSFPLSAASAEIRHGIGLTLLLVTIGSLVLLTIAALIYGIDQLRWTSLIVGSGMIFLFAPFLVQDLPPGLKDSRAGLALLLVLSCFALASLILFAWHSRVLLLAAA